IVVPRQIFTSMAVEQPLRNVTSVRLQVPSCLVLVAQSVGQSSSGTFFGSSATTERNRHDTTTKIQIRCDMVDSPVRDSDRKLSHPASPGDDPRGLRGET